MNLNIISILNRKCDFACKHCSSSSSPSENGFINISDVFRALEDYSPFLGVKRHLISGGEPTLNPRLKEVAQFSLNLDYKTSIVTNGSWIVPEDLKKTEKLFGSFFPENSYITMSLDFYHLKNDKNLIQKLGILERMCDGRNELMLDGAYNGIDEKKKLQNLPHEISLVPMQNIGKAKKMKNLQQIDENFLYCPKGNNKGFTLTEDGVYFCYRAALNKNDKLKISKKYSPEVIDSFFESFSCRDRNKLMRDFYFHNKEVNFNNICDVCEKI